MCNTDEKTTYGGAMQSLYNLALNIDAAENTKHTKIREEMKSYISKWIHNDNATYEEIMYGIYMALHEELNAVKDQIESENNKEENYTINYLATALREKSKLKN